MSSLPDELVAPLVFICYTHDSEQHKTDVLRFATFLRTCGIDAQLDRWFLGDRRDWFGWSLDLMCRADFAIIVASPQCRLVGDGRHLANTNHGGQSELSLLRELLQTDRDTWTRRLLPVLLPGHDLAEIPLFLLGRAADHYQVTELTQSGAESLLRVLTAQPPFYPPPLGPRPDLPPHQA
jgi:hypothetical protein